MPIHPASLAEPWWKRGVVYQVYPWSLQDTNGDGIGDLPGIRARLDHFERLGVDALWLSPVFVSPMKDFGYDVADYCAVDPLFGTIDDLDALIADAHARDIRILLDFVPNHTSDQHPWFRESRTSRDNPKADWYMWHDPAPGGGPPTNWLSMFGGGGWTFCEERGQYYYHAFLTEQPDLNWRNPAVVAAMHDVLRFWLKRGVDGYRVDVIWHLLKDPLWRDNPPNPDFKPGDPGVMRLKQTRTCDQPGIHDVIRAIRGVIDEFPDRVLIGELYLDLETLCTYYGTNLDGCHLPFNFQLMMNPWRADVVARLIETYEAALPAGAWPNWVLGNHDNPRIASRVGPAQARVAAMFLLTVRGTPTLFQGEELGLTNGIIPRERVRDPQDLNEPGIPNRDRDIARTPMQWDASRYAGFSTVEPWLPLVEGHETVNAAAEETDPRSMLSLHRRLLALRRERAPLAIGDITVLTGANDVLAYMRCRGGERLCVALNFSHEPREVALPEATAGRIVLTTGLDRQGEAVGETLRLGPDEGVVIEIGE